MTRKGDVT